MIHRLQTTSCPADLEFVGDARCPTTTLQDSEHSRCDAERWTHEASTDLSIRDTTEEIRAHELEAVPTLIHTQQTKDRFWRGFAVPIEPWRRLINWDAAQRALP